MLSGFITGKIIKFMEQEEDKNIPLGCQVVKNQAGCGPFRQLMELLSLPH